MQILTDEMKDFLEAVLPEEELEKMTDEEKVQFCLDDREAQERAYDDLIASRGQY